MPAHRILIVDDEPLELDAWRRTFVMAGYTVTTATNANDALIACDEHAFDLVILDFIMPSMTGVELLARIRKKRPLIRSIIVSGKIDKDADEEGLTTELKTAVEADGYIHKPVANDRLLETVAELLAQLPTERSWTDIAKMVNAAQKATIKAARNASKNLKKRIKKKK